MNNKLAQAVEAVLKKTKVGELEWERIDRNECRENPFFQKYVFDNYIELDGIHNYRAAYNDGYIYFNNSAGEGYREVAIQPKKDADITVLSIGHIPVLEELETEIKYALDNPDEFIDSLLE